MSRWLPTGKSSRAALAVALLAALVLDFVFFTGFIGSDDGAYLFGSHDLASGRDFAVTLASARLAVVIPDSFILWIAGGSIEWVAWFHVLYHLALVLVGFHLGRLIGGQRVGLIAAALIAINPLYYIFAGIVLPDNALAMWAGVFLIMLETVRQRTSAGTMSHRLSMRWFFVSGLVLGVAYSCKETALILTIPAAVSVMAAAPSLRSTAWIEQGAAMVAGLALLVLLEALAFLVLSGEGVWRLGLMQGTSGILEQRMAVQGVTPFERFGYAYETCLQPYLPISVWLLLLGSIAYAALRRRSLMLMTFMWWPLLFLTVGTTSFTEYRPQSMQARYYSLVVLPAAIMTAAFLVRAFEWAAARAWARRALPPALVVLLSLLTFYESGVNSTRAGGMYMASYARGFTEAVDDVSEAHPAYRVVAEQFYRGMMRPAYFDGAPPNLDLAASIDDPPEPPFVYLQRDSRSLRASKDRHGVHVIDSGWGPLAVRQLRTVAPLESRVTELGQLLRGLLRLPARSPPRSAIGRVAVQLVTHVDSDARSERGPELYRFDARARLVHLVSGVFEVAWEPGPRFFIQFFDQRTYKAAPISEKAQLPSRPRELKVTARYRLTRGRRVSITFYLYGYDETGAHRFVETTTTVENGHEVSSLTLTLESPVPLVSYKVRTKVADTGEAGRLQVFPPRLDSN